ncbi:glycosyltransferase [Nodosilinea sp. LEGE 07088]|uniref:glycosyltransferase n=1 Tax=Nodosilinea sp. LEGE 07088 TaxID=2777968 RepID=UPI00187EA665|nr:glycosyltransferase [Nodosilinea sp. LEGE 07088]MBE9137570.1 glycosyltransferase [Nodosilinea sp. LEGE 07088]
MKIALVHDYLTQRGGAERVFELLCKRFPDADIFTSLYDPEHTIDLRDRIVKTTALQSIPGAAQHFRMFAPLYFPAFRLLELDDYDLVLSSTTSFAKAVRTRDDALHICFCHNITRFLWDTKTYLRGFKEYQMLSPLLEPIFHQMRRLDLHYASEPNIYVANSSTVAKRIEHIYSRPASFINYPIDGSQFKFSDKKDDFYLVSCRLLSYKRVDIIVEAFNWLGWPLVIMGDGPERERLEELALDNITFIGHVSDEERTRLFAKAQMVIVAALEDYGLVPIEANFSGTPVVAYGAGGVLDTQVPGVTGVFFNRQTPDAVQAAMLEAQAQQWDYPRIHRHAIANFTEAAFFQKLDNFLKDTVSAPMAEVLGLNLEALPHR